MFPTDRPSPPTRPFLAVLALAALCTGAAIAAGSPVQVHDNPATPAAGTITIDLRELWRVGADDEEVLLGLPSAAVRDADGNLYLVDLQLATVHVFAPDGTFLRDIGREGEGPGELRRPAGIVLMPDGRLGVAQRFPGRIVLLHPDGTPAGTLLPGGDATAGGFSSLDLVRQRSGVLVVRGARMSRGDGVFRREIYVAVLDGDGRERARLYGHAQVSDMSRPRFVEKDSYAPPVALGPGGTIYLAPERDRYVVRVHDGNGQPLYEITRAWTPRRRTAEEKDRVGRNIMFRRNGRRVRVEREVCDTDPAISALRVTATGELWVLARSGNEPPEPDGFQTWDVFDRDGHYRYRAAIACEGDPDQDRLLPVDDTTWVLVRGARSAMEALRGGGDDEQSDQDVQLEVVVYRQE